MTRNEGDGSGRTQGNKATRIRAQPVWRKGPPGPEAVQTNCCTDLGAGRLEYSRGGEHFSSTPYVRTSEAPGLPVRKLRLSNRETARALVPELGDNGDCVLHEG